MFDLNTYQFTDKTSSQEPAQDVEFLLPNGYYLSLKFPRDSRLSKIKETLWQNLSKFAHEFKSPENYTLSSVNRNAETVEFLSNHDEKLSDLNLVHNFFRVTEIEGNIEEKLFNSDLTKLIGFSIDELNHLKDEEVIKYRLEVFKIARERLFAKSTAQTRDRFRSSYSQNVEVDLRRLCSLRMNQNEFGGDASASRKRTFSITIHEVHNGVDENQSLDVFPDNRPSQIIKLYFRTKLNATPLAASQSQLEAILNDYLEIYVMNVCGCNDVVFGDEYPIRSYKYVIKCLSAKKTPHFFINTYENLLRKLPMDNLGFLQNNINRGIFELENKLERKSMERKPRQNTILSWTCDRYFEIYLELVSFLPFLFDCDKIFFRIAIYLGQEPLTGIIESKRFDSDRINEDLNLSSKIDQRIDMGIKISDLHRCSKLCLCLYYVTKRKRETIPFAWISFYLFDYERYLINGKKSVYMWNINDSNQSFPYLCQFHTTGSNSSNDYVRLKIEFPNESIIYPDKTQIENFVQRQSMNYHDECFDIDYMIENDNKLLENIARRDQLAELTEQDKKVLWRRRHDCLTYYPESLSKLMQAVKWNNKNDVIETYGMLFRWPDLRPADAIELLTSVHADIEVRKFAVRCLHRHMRNEELEMYLLQLVQALKNEPYFDNDLARFLLRRAYENMRIGFTLFWNLKSELKTQKHKYKFSILIEAYCRGLGGNLELLLKQVDAIEKLAFLTQSIKSNFSGPPKDSYLQDTLSLKEYRHFVEMFTDPLDCSHVLGEIEPTKSKVLSSAKRPLYLTWINKSEYAELFENTRELIFKHGDDLRQDMLTLQALKLINNIWMEEGLDLKMLVYDCASTGHKIGFIEVIRQSLTIFKIQTEGGSKGKYQIDTDQLYRWICANNPNERYEEAIENFTKSCAGFCVATFILGIGDRHPDNIMVNKEGKLFHIDFGHFLGHFKKKLGFKRERVPFVLTEDFTKVISRGALASIFTEDFQRFKNLCEHAYMIIRRYSSLIIDLFVMMLSSEMPELQSVEDIMYLRNKLAIDESDDRALEFFRSQFDEAVRMSFTTKFDWVFHALNKSDKISQFKQLPYNFFFQ